MLEFFNFLINASEIAVLEKQLIISTDFRDPCTDWNLFSCEAQW